MANEIILPDELVKAARNLERRYQMLRVPSRKIPAAEWDALPKNIRSVIPDWIPTLLGNYSLHGGVLEYWNARKSYARHFSFAQPSDYAYELAEGEERLEILPKSGLVPFGYESDGSMWVTKITDGPSEAIYMLEHTGWGGGEPTLDNGLVFASRRLSLMFACMAVSDVSYNEMPGSKTSVLWIKEKPIAQARI